MFYHQLCFTIHFFGCKIGILPHAPSSLMKHLQLFAYLSFGSALIVPEAYKEVSRASLAQHASTQAPPQQFRDTLLFENIQEDRGSYFDTHGFHGWTKDIDLAALTSDCAKAIREILPQLQNLSCTIASHGLCTIKVGGPGTAIPGDRIEEWALDMLLILSRNPFDQLYEPELSGTYFGDFYGKVLCMGTEDRACEAIQSTTPLRALSDDDEFDDDLSLI